MKRILSIIICAALVLSTVSVSAAEAPDYIDIGDETKEYGAEFVNASEPQTTITADGAEHTYRTLGIFDNDNEDDNSGSITVTMKCDPQKTNYLTVKLWGEDTGSGMLWLTAPDGNMNVFDNKPPIRNGGIDRRDWVELNFSDESPQYDGGFIYSTYIIPKIYTEEKSEVTLVISSTGGQSDYAKTQEDRIKSQTEPSRGIYAVYMTQDACFDPKDFNETVSGGLKETAAVTPKDNDTQKATALGYFKSAVETFKSWQIYGADNYPLYMEGMITRTTSWKSKSKTDTDWNDIYYSDSGMLKQNMTPLNGLELFALAYKNADELGYSADEKTELLERVIAGIDFLCRAQGSNGGFFSGGGWIGGPKRKPASGNNLTGFGLRSVAEALVMLYPEINAAGYIGTTCIDRDADGEVDPMGSDYSGTRLYAWTDMMKNARDYLLSLDGAGHAPNQDMVDIIAALRFERVMEENNLYGKWSNPSEEIIKQLDIAFGFEPNISCSSYWVSPKGLILENFGSIQGGYSGDYGINALEEMSQLAEIAEAFADKGTITEEQAEKYAKVVDKAYDAADNFMFTANAEVGAEPTLYSEGLTSNRNAYYPGTVRYVTDCYAALKLGNKTALKNVEYFLNHNRLSANNEYSALNAHFEDNVLNAARLWLNFNDYTAAIENKDIQNYDYVMENDDVKSYAWADEMGRNVVIKYNGERIYIALNWRNPVHSTTVYNTAAQKDNQQGRMNNLARVHCTNDKFDRYGYADMTTEDWLVQENGMNQSDWQKFDKHYADAFMYMRYGDYAVVMNSTGLTADDGKEYPVPAEALGLDGDYVDLISGEAYSFGSGEVTIAPATTMVLVKPNDAVRLTDAKYAGEKVTAQLETENGGAGIVTLYAAEYEGETLKSVAVKTAAVNNTSAESIDIIKTAPENKIRLFAWDGGMKPAGEAREV